ncbi:MAG: tryptophan synthase subunit alpha [Sedimentisphaerales bacterium]|nr:tryptophan synthase subunit alpha [Sedimentisphaerales bacterium]
MKTYADVFANAKRTVLIPFFVLGDPDEAQSLDYIRAAIDAGADILELGIPFSDPIADGPTIQKADIRALDAGMTCRRALAMIRRIKEIRDIPIGLLMYYNLIWHYGPEAFYRDAAAAGVNSVLVADLCVDDAGEVEPLIEANHLESVYMVTPNTSAQRRAKIAQLCRGFIYTVSVLGVTGARTELGTQIKPLVKSLKAQTQVPVCVGFGVSRAEHARELAAAGADGVIVGSALVQIIEKNLTNPSAGRVELTELLGSLKEALEARPL